MKNKKQILTIVLSVFVVFAVVFTVVIFMKPSQISPETKNENGRGVTGEATEKPKTSESKPAEEITVMQLASDPEKYDGKLVRITGFHFLEYPACENGIFASKNDYYDQTGNAVQIKYEKNSPFDNAFEGGYVLAEGVFDQSDRGEKDTFCGTLKNVSRYELWDKEKGCSLSQLYTITSNGDLTTTYKIKDKDGKVILSETTSRGGFIYQVSENVLAYWGQAGTGLFTRWAAFCDVESGRVTGKTMGAFLAAQGNYVVLGDFREGEFLVIVQDLFDSSTYCKEYVLKNSSPAADVILGAKIVEDGKCVVMYLTGDDYQETEMEISFP